MVVEEQTKKEQIINLAQNDPFLKISDIALYVKTTPRYVRTILSEANISLMKLRKRYARSMEKRLRLQDEERQKALLLLKEEERVSRGDLVVSSLESTEENGEEESLFRLSQVSLYDERPYILHELTVKEEYLSFDDLENRDTIYQLLAIKGDLYFTETKIRLMETKEPWSHELSLEEGAMVITAQRDMGQGTDIVARENLILDARVLENILQGELVV